MEIDLSENTQKKLQKLAQKEGKSVDEIIAHLLNGTSVPESNGESSKQASVDFHDKVTDLKELITSQGVTPQRFQDLIGDFWPEEDSVDDFLSARRDWHLNQ